MVDLSHGSLAQGLIWVSFTAMSQIQQPENFSADPSNCPKKTQKSCYIQALSNQSLRQISIIFSLLYLNLNKNCASKLDVAIGEALVLPLDPFLDWFRVGVDGPGSVFVFHDPSRYVHVVNASVF